MLKFPLLSFTKTISPLGKQSQDLRIFYRERTRSRKYRGHHFLNSTHHFRIIGYGLGHSHLTSPPGFNSLGDELARINQEAG
jgi:hypothetical protein